MAALNTEWEQLRFDFPAQRHRPTLEEYRTQDLPFTPSLIDPQVLERIEDGDWYRASGAMICNRCGLTYRVHPVVPTAALNILCDGRLVHL